MFRDSEVKTGAGLQSSSLPDEKKTKLNFKDWPLHPVLFGVLYVLTSFQQICPFSSVAELFNYLIPVLAVILIAQLVLQRFYSAPYKGAILASFFIVPFCFFGDLRMQLSKVLSDTRWEELTRLRYLLVAMVCGCLVLGWLVIRSRKNFLILNRYLNLVSGVMILVTIVQIVLVPAVPEVPVGKKANTPLHLPQNPPDVYYILADAYTSAESLKKYWDYDNSPFLNSLTQEGFHIVKNAHGNADFTPRCLSTYLNMNYPPVLSAQFPIAARVKFLSKVIESAEAPSRFKASGYKITALSIFATGGEPRFYFFPVIGNTTFGEFLFNKTVLGYLNNFRKRTGFGDTNLKIFSNLSKVARGKTSQPKFVYAHLLMPHEPFLFDREGNRVKRGMSGGTVKKEDYLDQLIYENTLLTNAVSEILKNSKTPPIIIIQGDHGFRHLPLEHRKDESTTILNALYLPGAKEDWVYDGMTPVNTFRMIFNRYFGENYEYVPDSKTLYLTGEHE